MFNNIPKGGCRKVTDGTYVQIFDEKGHVIDSQFIAGTDSCYYYVDENMDRICCNNPKKPFYAPFDTSPTLKPDDPPIVSICYLPEDKLTPTFVQNLANLNKNIKMGTTARITHFYIKREDFPDLTEHKLFYLKQIILNLSNLG